MSIEARALLRSSTIIWPGDPEILIKHFAEADPAKAIGGIFMQDLDAAESVGVYFHELDHIRRSQSTTIGLLLQVSEAYRLALSSLLIEADLGSDNQEFLLKVLAGLVHSGEEPEGAMTSEALHPAAAKILTAITDFQNFLLAGIPESAAGSIGLACSKINALFCPGAELSVSLDPLSFRASVEKWARRGAPNAKAKHLAALCSTLPRGARSLFECLADSSAKTMSGYYPDRGYDLYFGRQGRETNRVLRDEGQTSETDFSQNLKTIESLLGHDVVAQTLFSEYKAVFTLAGEWCSDFVVNNKANAEQGEYIFGHQIALPIEFWAVISYAVNPPLVSSGDGPLSWIKDANSLDSLNRYLSALNYFRDEKFSTPFTLSGIEGEQRFTEVLDQLYSELDGVTFNYGSLRAIKILMIENAPYLLPEDLLFAWPLSPDSVGYWELLNLDGSDAKAKILLDFNGELDFNEPDGVVETFLDHWNVCGWRLDKGRPIMSCPSDMRMKPLYEEYVEAMHSRVGSNSGGDSYIIWQE